MNDPIQPLTASHTISPRDDLRSLAGMVVSTTSVIKKPAESTQNPAEPRFDPEKLQEILKEVVERLNNQMKAGQRNLGFSVDERINTFIVTVRDTNTGELVRQIPSEVVVKMAHSIEDLKGIIFNEIL